MVILEIDRIAPAALWLAAVLVLGAAGIWLVRKWRGDDAEDTQDAHLSLVKFRELHARGGLSDEEYRTIKTKLATQLEEELDLEPADLSAREATAASNGVANLDDDAGAKNIPPKSND